MRTVAAFVIDLCGLLLRAEGQTARSQPVIKNTHSHSRPSQQAPTDHFTGSACVDPVFPTTRSARADAALVTFGPGSRPAWHTHPWGQTPIVTDGVGWIQQWGGPVEIIRNGDIVQIPPDVKHWHGAAASTSMTHLAIVEAFDGKTVQRMEPVSGSQNRGRNHEL